MQRQNRYIMRSNTMTREKRGFDEGDGEDVSHEAKRPKVPALASVIVEALKVDSLQKLCSSLEPILRRVVSEEVERALAKLGPAKLEGRPSPKRLEGPDGRNLQLHFRSRLSLPLFTGGRVEGEQGAAIHVVLLDANSGHVVTSGPESSAKLDVVVLDGEFNNDNNDDWTEEDFDCHIVKEREGKRPLLTGELQVSLKEGVGTLGELTFTDNSSWIRCRKFRLGIKFASGYCEGVHVREAKTEAFTVKDHRGELYKKHYPPALKDEVWRLEKIGKDGAFHKRLNKAGIHTVEDFLRVFVRDSHRLKNVLGSGMSTKMWESLVEHAKTCVLSGKYYVYYSDGTRNIGAIFNNIYEFSGLIAGGQYFSAETLDDSQKVFADDLVKKAYDNWMLVIEYDGKALLNMKHGKKTTKTELLPAPVIYPAAYDQQVGLPPTAVPASMNQPSIDPGLDVEGAAVSTSYSGNQVNRFPIQHQHVDPNSHMQFDHASFGPSIQFDNSSQQSGITRNDSTNLALAPPPQQNLGFNFMGHPIRSTETSSSYDDWSNHRNGQGVDDFLTEEEIRLRSHEMLENEDMQQLLRVLSMGGASGNLPEDGFGFPSFMPSPCSNYNIDDDHSRSSSKAVVGWLKIKAAMRWGIFIRKKAAEKRAQLTELDD